MSDDDTHYECAFSWLEDSYFSRSSEGTKSDKADDGIAANFILDFPELKDDLFTMDGVEGESPYHVSLMNALVLTNRHRVARKVWNGCTDTSMKICFRRGKRAPLWAMHLIASNHSHIRKLSVDHEFLENDDSCVITANCELALLYSLANNTSLTCIHIELYHCSSNDATKSSNIRAALLSIMTNNSSVECLGITDATSDIDIALDISVDESDSQLKSLSLTCVLAGDLRGLSRLESLSLYTCLNNGHELVVPEQLKKLELFGMESSEMETMLQALVEQQHNLEAIILGEVEDDMGQTLVDCISNLASLNCVVISPGTNIREETATYMLAGMDQLEELHVHLGKRDFEYLFNEYWSNPEKKLRAISRDASNWETMIETNKFGQVTAREALEKTLATGYNCGIEKLYFEHARHKREDIANTNQEEWKKIELYVRLNAYGRHRLLQVNATKRDFVKVVSSIDTVQDIFAMLTHIPHLWIPQYDL